jgi:hypothetical protein
MGTNEPVNRRASRRAVNSRGLAQTKVRATYPHPFYLAAFTTYGLYR